MKLIRVDSLHSDFILLCKKLDSELNARYGISQSKYNKHNTIEFIETVLVGYVGKEAAACGCFKVFDHNTVEIKRMFVHEKYRNRKFSSKLLLSLETWSSELGFSNVILETGKGQPEAISLYRSRGYQIIENYGPYIGLPNSVCMEKNLKKFKVVDV